MIVILYTKSCKSSSKTLNFFAKNLLKFSGINILKDDINEKLLKDILSLTENGFQDIISKRSEILIDKGICIDDLTTQQLIDLIVKNPIILKRPIIIQYKANAPYRLLVGYNVDDILIFMREKQKSYI